MKITSIIKDLNETVGYILSENTQEKKVSVQELIILNQKLENATIQNQQIRVYNSELLPVIQINKTILGIQQINKKLELVDMVKEAIKYEIADKEIILTKVNSKIRASIEIPYGVTKIGELAFSGCELLTRIKLPNSVTNIGKEAFYGCKSLTSLVLSNECELDKNELSACKSVIIERR